MGRGIQPPASPQLPIKNPLENPLDTDTPHPNARFYNFKLVHYRQINGRTDRRTYGLTDGQTNQQQQQQQQRRRRRRRRRQQQHQQQQQRGLQIIMGVRGDGMAVEIRLLFSNSEVTAGLSYTAFLSSLGRHRDENNLAPQHLADQSDTKT